MFMFLPRLIFVSGILSIHYSHAESDNLLTWKSCNYGDTIENLCNKCVCTSKGMYVCEPKDCPPTVFEFYLHSQKACHPNAVYTQGPTSCICTSEGRWPHKTCYDTFKYLPEIAITKKTCKPNGYFKVDCNICRCNSKGEVDTARCTLNECDEKPTLRKNNNPDLSNLFGTCLVKNWYSLAPCQFCYCMDTNKLICSTTLTDAHKGDQMALGKSNLVLCGAGLLKEVAALVPGTSSYRSNKHSSHISSIKSTEESSRDTSDDDEKELGLRASKVSQENMEYDESNKVQTLQRYRDSKKGIKTSDIEINLAGTIDAEIEPNKMSSKQRRLPRDPFKEIRKFLKSNRRVLTLDGAAKCKPGSIITVKCNICHCLKNGKMLCADKKCD